MTTLAEIKSRLEKATPHNWVVSETTSIDGFIADCGESLDGEKCYVKRTRPALSSDAKEDATFIANAPSDIKFLLKQIEDWESDYKHLREAVRTLEGHLPEMKTLLEEDRECGITRASDEEIHALNVINEHLEFDFLKPITAGKE